MRLRILGVLVLLTALAATTTQASAQTGGNTADWSQSSGVFLETHRFSSFAQDQTAGSLGPTMTVAPQSGVRPLSVVVTGSPCLLTKPVAGTPGPPVRIVWQVEGNPSTQQIRIIPSEAGANWTTTLVLGVPNLGVNLISATCVGPADEALVTYPPQKVEVLPVSPVLSASPTSITVGQSITATADRCPDPELPRLGGGYFVRFTLEYLTPPDGTEGPYSESAVVWTNNAGTASTIFNLPANAPTQGGAYRIRASCELEELGSTIALFNYASVAIQVSAVATPTPEPTATVLPTATVVPTATPTPGPSPTVTPGPTPQPTATPAPTSTPWPQPTPTPRPGCCVIIFTG